MPNIDSVYIKKRTIISGCLFQLPARFQFEGYAVFIHRKHMISDEMVKLLWKSDELLPNDNAAMWMPKTPPGNWNFNVAFMRLDKFKYDSIFFQQLPDSFNGW